MGMNGKSCPYCGEPLPPGASFCPHCAQSVGRKQIIQPPTHLWGKIARRVLAAAVVLAVLGAAVWAWMPKTYEGRGEVIYTDDDGTYQLLLGEGSDRFAPVPEVETDFARKEIGRMPSRFYVNHVDTGVNAADAFMRKVDSVSVAFGDQEGNPSPMICDPPAAADYAPEAAMVSRLTFTGESGSEELVWTIKMDNGDTIRLRQQITVHPVDTYEYHWQDYPMETAEQLQALMDQIGEEVAVPNVVNVYLPPVTYTQPVELASRPMNLYGCTDGPQPTTFTDTLSVTAKDGDICYLYDLEFRGGGDGVGLSASARVWAERCRFSGWRTGALVYGDVWGNVIDCTFLDNQVGFHFNSDGAFASHTGYQNNSFRNNGTAVVLENVPTDTAMNFEGSRFTRNGVDIDNRCGQAVDITKAIIE